MTARRDWTEDELRVLAAIYFNADFSVGDDARDECRTMAACFERNAAAIDRQWRNIDAVVKGKAGNIGQLVRDTATAYLTNPAAYTQLAVHICENRRWPLIDLIREGYQMPANKPLQQGIDSDICDVLSEFAMGLEFRLFPAGAQGFQREGIIGFAGARFNVRISAVAVGSRANRAQHVRARPVDIASALKGLIARVEAKVFGTGRTGYYGEGRLMVCDEPFQVTIRAVQVGEVRI